MYPLLYLSLFFFRRVRPEGGSEDAIPVFQGKSVALAVEIEGLRVLVERVEFLQGWTGLDLDTKTEGFEKKQSRVLR